MLCPYCGEEIGKGFIQSSRMMLWSRKKKKMFFITNPSKGDITIADGINGAYKESFLCKNCKKIIVDLKND